MMGIVFYLFAGLLLPSLCRAEAVRLNLPQHFSVEVFPALHTDILDQQPVVYHFDGERVYAQWERIYHPGEYDNRDVTTTRMEGTFHHGVLKGEQVSELTGYAAPSTYRYGHPGGPSTKLQYHGTIEGTLQADGRIKARVTTTLTGYQAYTLVRGTGEGPPVFHWEDRPVANQSPAVLDYWIALPSDNWFNGRYVHAGGAETFGVRTALERLERYMTEAGNHLMTGQYAMAQRQTETLRAEIADLGETLAGNDNDTRVSFHGLPTDDVMLKRIRLQFMMAKWKEAYTIVNEALARVQQESADLSNVLSANIFKAIIKNYLNWSNSIPTDVVSGIAGYSATTAVTDLPRGFLSWYEDGRKDAGILNDQFRRKQALAELDGYYQDKRTYIVDQRREVATLLKTIDQDPVVDLDRSLQGFFASLGWAPWQADPQRQTALALLRQAAGDKGPQPNN